MGCHQSKVEEQVVAPVAVSEEPVAATVEATEEVAAAVEPTPEATVAVEEPAAEAPAPVEAEVAEPASKEEETPAAEEVAVEASSAPAAEEATPEPVAEAEVVVETPAPVQQEEATPVVTAPTPLDEAPASSSHNEEIQSTTAQPSETVEVVSVPPSEATVEDPPHKEEPEVEINPAEDSDEPATPKLSFASAGVAIGEGHVVYYQFTLTDKSAPEKQVTLRKRFNDFKSMHEHVAKLMASESNVPASQTGKFQTYPALPALPKAGVSTVLFGRRNKTLMAEREAQFGKILNAIARHPIAYDSAAFQGFLA